MKYWDFSVKSKSILPLVATSEDMIIIFTVYKTGLFKNSRLTFLPKKGWNLGLLSEITPRTLTFLGQTADITYFLHATRKNTAFGVHSMK